MHLDNQKENAKIQQETQKNLARIHSVTSHNNNKDQVCTKNQMHDYQQKESTTHITSIIENTNFSKQPHYTTIIHQIIKTHNTPPQ